MITDAGQSGRLTITHHRCLSPADMSKTEKFGINSENECEDITEELLASLYEISPTEPFTTVAKLDGQICWCQKSLCNLPTKQNKKSSSSSAGIVTPALILVLPLILICLCNLNSMVPH